MSTSVWVGYPKSTKSMTDVNGLGPGFGGTVAAPIWRDYMQQASDGYCGDFAVPSYPFQGVPFYGHYANTGESKGGAGGAGAVTGTPVAPATGAGAGQRGTGTSAGYGNVARKG